MYFNGFKLNVVMESLNFKTKGAITNYPIQPPRMKPSPAGLGVPHTTEMGNCKTKTLSNLVLRNTTKVIAEASQRKSAQLRKLKWSQLFQKDSGLLVPRLVFSCYNRYCYPSQEGGLHTAACERRMIWLWFFKRWFQGVGYSNETETFSQKLSDPTIC